MAVDKTKFTKGANCGTDFLRVQHRRIGGKFYRMGYSCWAINSLCYSKPWQKSAILSDYQEGSVDTKLPESLWDTMTKYHWWCANKCLSICVLYFDMLAQRMRVNIR